jgi:hypothetical protein
LFRVIVSDFCRSNNITNTNESVMLELTQKIESKTLRNELNAKLKQKTTADDIAIQLPQKEVKSKMTISVSEDDVQLMIFHQIYKWERNNSQDPIELIFKNLKKGIELTPEILKNKI